MLSGLIDLQGVRVRAVSSTGEVTGHSGLNQMIHIYLATGSGNFQLSVGSRDPTPNIRERKVTEKPGGQVSSQCAYSSKSFHPGENTCCGGKGNSASSNVNRAQCRRE